MKHDPRFRRKGGRYVCARPGCEKPLTEIAFKHLDPFCSTRCCHEYHGVEIQMNPTKRGTPVGSSS